MKLELFLIVGYYLFMLYLIKPLIGQKEHSISHKAFWISVLVLFPFIGVIIYTLFQKKQYGRPNELRTILR